MKLWIVYEEGEYCFADSFIGAFETLEQALPHCKAYLLNYDWYDNDIPSMETEKEIVKAIELQNEQACIAFLHILDIETEEKKEVGE